MKNVKRISVVVLAVFSFSALAAEAVKLERLSQSRAVEVEKVEARYATLTKNELLEQPKDLVDLNPRSDILVPVVKPILGSVPKGGSLSDTYAESLDLTGAYKKYLHMRAEKIIAEKKLDKVQAEKVYAALKLSYQVLNKEIDLARRERLELLRYVAGNKGDLGKLAYIANEDEYLGAKYKDLLGGKRGSPRGEK